MSFLIKGTGVCLVIFAASAYGMMMGKELKARLSELKELKKIMFLFKSEIAYGKTPIFEAAQNISGRCSPFFKKIFEDFCECEKLEKNKMIDEIWKEVMSKGFLNSHLSRQEQNSFIEVGKSLGLMNSDTQEKTIDIYLSELSVSIEELEKTVPAKVKMYNSLGVMLGVIITIIMI